jgi:hypothetical protein
MCNKSYCVSIDHWCFTQSGIRQVVAINLMLLLLFRNNVVLFAGSAIIVVHRIARRRNGQSTANCALVGTALYFGSVSRGLYVDHTPQAFLLCKISPLIQNWLLTTNLNDTGRFVEDEYIYMCVCESSNRHVYCYYCRLLRCWMSVWILQEKQPCYCGAPTCRKVLGRSKEDRENERATAARRKNRNVCLLLIIHT